MSESNCFKCPTCKRKMSKRAEMEYRKLMRERGRAKTQIKLDTLAKAREALAKKRAQNVTK